MFGSSSVEKLAVVGSVVATLLGSNGVEATSLRSSILGELSAKSNQLAARSSMIPGFCTGIVGSPNDQDRYCEHGTGRASICQCREQCHIFGDPHVEPFLTACDFRTLKQEGWYSFFESKETGSKKIGIFGYSEPLKVNDARDAGIPEPNGPTEYWVSKLYLDIPHKGGRLSKVVLTADECTKAAKDGTMPMGGDSKRTKRKAKQSGRDYFYHPYAKYLVDVTVDGFPVQVEITAICSKRGSAPMHVDTNIEILDDCRATRADPDPAENSDNELRATVMMFPYSAGVCMNPCNDDLAFLGGKGQSKPSGTAERDFTHDSAKCRRQLLKEDSSKCVKREGEIDGKVCTLGAQCAVHGDPYLASFYKPHPQEGSGDECIKNAVLADPDDFAFSQKSQPLRTRESYVREIDVPARGVAGSHQRQCIEIFPKQAESSMTDREQQQSIQSQELYFVPGQIQVLAETNECQLITAVTVSFKRGNDPVDSYTYTAADLCPEPEDGGKLTPGSTGVLIPVPSEDDQSDFFNSTLQGFVLTGTNFDSGAVQVNLKCHITKSYNSDDGSTGQRPYFNVCIERKNTEYSQKANDEDLELNFFEVETDLYSRGWCQTGLIVDKAPTDERALFDWEEMFQEGTVEYSQECLLGTKSCL